MRKPWNLPSYPVYSLLTENIRADGNFQKQEVGGRKNISKGVYDSIHDGEIESSDDEIRRFSKFSRNMNIMTYVIPVSMKPKHYILAIYHDTKSLENWSYTHRGILQILASEHASIVGVLGKKSGKSYDKMKYLGKKGLLDQEGLLTDIAGYIELEEVEKLPHASGDHELYLCRVVSSRSYHENILETKHLIEQKIIL